MSKLKLSSSTPAVRHRPVCTDDVVTPQKKVSFADPLEQPSSVSASPGHSFSFPSASSENVPFGKSLDYHSSSSPVIAQACLAVPSSGLFSLNSE